MSVPASNLAGAPSNVAPSGAQPAEITAAHSVIQSPENNKAHSQAQLADGSAAQSAPSFSQRLARLNGSQGLTFPFPFRRDLLTLRPSSTSAFVCL
jgi:hypothetical protein